MKSNVAAMLVIVVFVVVAYAVLKAAFGRPPVARRSAGPRTATEAALFAEEKPERSATQRAYDALARAESVRDAAHGNYLAMLKVPVQGDSVARGVLIAEAKARFEEAEWKVGQAEHDVTWAVSSAKTCLLKKSSLTSAFPSDYAKWLRGYIERGGSITHTYDYDMPEDFFIATQDMQIPAGACGAAAFQVIAPIGVKVTHEGFDYCNVYAMDYSVRPGWVPLYNDVARILKGGVKSGKESSS